MKRRRQTHLLNLAQPSHVIGVGAVVVCVCLAVVMLVAEKMRPEMMASIRGQSSDVVAPVAELLSAPQNVWTNTTARIDTYFNTHEENARLIEENAKLLKWQSLAHQYSKENEQLKQLLNVVPESEQHYISARMVGAASAGMRYVSLISAGAEDGVKKNLAVIGTGGLIGRVIEVGDSNARVLLINDINANIPVVGERSGLKAILTGHPGRNELKLDLAEKPDALQVGDRLVTSGDGGMIPPGIPVANITSISGFDIAAAPIADIDRASIVTVVDYSF